MGGGTPVFPFPIALNRATYNIVLDKLYRAIHWRCVDENMIKSLLCLRDPSIAARVRSLALETEHMFIERERQPWLRTKATQVLKLSQKSIRRSRSVGIRSEVRAFKATLSQTKDVLEAMHQAFAKMTCLECCIIDAGNKLHPKSMEPPAMSLLLTISLVVGRNLRFLVLQGTVHHLSAWVTSARMERLEELVVTVLAFPAHFGSGSEHSEDQKFIVSRLAPFINSVSPSLSKLQLSLSCEFDLSDFLRALTDIPHLCHLLLQASLYPTFQSNPNALCEFLAEKVPPRCRVHLVGIFQSDPMDHPRGFEDTASSAHSRLPVNTLYRSQEMDIDIIATLTKHLGDRLESIHLYQYSLSIPQFEALATMKTNITLLHHLRVQTLKAAFFHFLSLQVSCFMTLGLVYEEIYSNGDGLYDDYGRSTFLVRAIAPGHSGGGWPLRNIRFCELQPQAEFIIHAKDISVVSMTREAAPYSTIMIPGCNLDTVGDDCNRETIERQGSSNCDDLRQCFANKEIS